MHDTNPNHPIIMLSHSALHSTDAMPCAITSRLSTAVHMILCGAHHADEAIALATAELDLLARLSTDTQDEEFSEEHLVFAAYSAALNPVAFLNNLKLLPTTDASAVKIALADCLEMADKWFTVNFKHEDPLVHSLYETISKLRA